MSRWIGYAVSVSCGEPLGCYQGTILEADGSTITLTKAFRNGFPYPKSQVTLNAADIKELKIIEAAAERGAPAHSTVAVGKGKKQRTTVCESLQASQAEPRGKPAPPPAPTAPRAKPAPAATRAKPAPAPATPRAERARRRNEACFGACAEPALLDDFDFEGNLALFDKRALWQEMRARPDLLPRASPACYRHDENVVRAPAGGAGAPAARVPAELRGGRDYRTDAGAVLPSVTERARRLLWRALERRGLAGGARALLARAAADLCLRLAGGGRRLEARNAHQAPRVAVLAGAHAAGAAGLLAARLLAAHGARAAAHVAGAGECAEVAREAAAAAPDVPLVALEALGAPDVVLVALHEPAESSAEQAALGAALAWAGGTRAALVLLEPPAAGWAGVEARASLLALAPVLLAPSCGRVFLCNVGAPRGLLPELHYPAPFAAASLLQLHADTD